MSMIDWWDNLRSIVTWEGNSTKLRGGLLLLIPLPVQVIVPVLAMPITLSNLDQTDYGKFQLSLSILSWVTILTAPYITVGAMSAIARGKDGTLWKATKTRLWISLVLSGLVVPAALWVRHSDENLSMLLLLSIISLLRAPITHVATSYYTAQEQFAATAFWNSLSVIPSIAMAIGSLSHNIVIATAAFHLSGMLTNLISMVFVFSRFSILDSYRRNEIDSRAVSYGLKNLPKDVLSSTRRQLGSLIIVSFAGFQTLAVFAVGNGLASRLLDTVRLFSRIWFADFSTKTNSQAQIWVKRNRLVIVAVGFTITLAFNGLAVLYIHKFLPPAYAGAWAYALIISLAFPAALLYQAIMLVLTTHLYARKQVIIQSISNLIEIGSMMAFGWVFGIWGICLAIATARWISVPIAQSIAKGKRRPQLGDND